MICENCNSKDATVYITKIVNGKEKDINLCDECAKKKEISNIENNFSIHNFLANLLEGNTAPNINIIYKENKKCPQCGATYNDFKRSGRLGCDMCYPTFSEMLDPLIRRIQRSSIHSGKIPKRSGASIRILRDLNNLKGQLQQLVIREEFEEAVKVRDKIRRLEGEIDNE